MSLGSYTNEGVIAGVRVACAIVIAAGMIAAAYHHTAHAQTWYAATTTVSISVCGDGVPSPSKVCDDALTDAFGNPSGGTGQYALTIDDRNCLPDCTGFAAYCGDGIVQTFFGEECDDGNNLSGDGCSATCQNETTPVVEGGGGGGGTPGGGGGGSSGGGQGIPGASREGSVPFQGETSVVIRGRACPGATVTILRDGTVERVIEADGNANFAHTLTDQVPGVSTFSFWSVDRNQRRSITYSATFQVVQNAVTTLSGVLIPPTLVVTPDRVPPGGNVTFTGCAVPDTTVQAFVNGGQTPSISIVSGSGEWSILYDAASLAVEAFHRVRVNFIDPLNEAIQSGYSQVVTFYVGTREVDTDITADLNNDGRVDLTDFSILLFHWNTANPAADINQDGVVNLADFSIMLFYWTG
jgi:cysteine-rich repeat protein